MNGRFALVIGNTEYKDSSLARLSAPGKDAVGFARILEDKNICRFDKVDILLNKPAQEVSEAIESLFSQKKADDLLVLYFSGHGIRDELGLLYLAVTNTNRALLRSTAIRSNFVSELMDQSRSRRQILILDCCYSGAFPKGTKAESGGSAGAVTSFMGSGYGRVILTASDATQFAWEGNRVIGKTERSLFTHFLIQGLEGEADTNGDGRITLDELYDYTYEQIVSHTPKQTPRKWIYEQQGGILLRPSTRSEDIKPLPLPDELRREMQDPDPLVRQAVLQKLTELTQGTNLRLRPSAVAALEQLEKQRVEEERIALLKQHQQEGTITQPKIEAKSVLNQITIPLTPAKVPMYAIVLAVAFLAIGTIFRFLSNQGASPFTETAISQTATPTQTQLPTINPETPTSAPLTPTRDPLMKVGATLPYVDGTVLVAVPSGEFMMGGDQADNLEHQVNLKDYWIYSTEVTNQQYALCVKSGKCMAPNLEDNPSYSDHTFENNPVTGVTYEQARSYCAFVNGRLPSETEWEKAARNQEAESFPWGSDEPSCDRLNFNNCLEGSAPVVDYADSASFYGALNMSGNVFEWVADWYDARYYRSAPAQDPEGPENGTLRSVRSSSYASEPDKVAVSLRNFENPLNHRSDLGFRCVVDEPTHYAPFCELPVFYGTAGSQDAQLSETCPELEIKPAHYCNNDIHLTNVKFVGPPESKIDPKSCTLSPDPKLSSLYTCNEKGEIVSISASCQLSNLGDASCLPGYLKRGNLCIADPGITHAATGCLAGIFDSANHCCALPMSETEKILEMPLCPVGTFYAKESNACLPEPVQEIVTVSYEVDILSFCPSTPPSGGNNGGNNNGGGGCQASQDDIDTCNANAPFYRWDSKSCSCKPSN